ncbi:hypothetical protein FOA52_010391 [Chlamydomonas sp. UWO 241]|nr:hypothetical protein FOA52_010391 [Chlamydomonas sp. UWO 241]
MTRSKRKHSKAAGALVARAATATESPVSSGSSDSDLRPRNRACVDETQITLLARPGALGAATYAEAVQHLHGGASNHISASADTTDAIRALSAAVDDLRGLVQAQQIASLVDLVRLLLMSRVPGAPMHTPHAVPHAAHSAPRAAPAAKATQPARPAAAAAPVASAAGAPAAERPAAAGAARAASACGPCRRGGLPARVGDASLRLSFVASFSVEDAIVFVTGGDGCGHANDVFSGCFADDAEEARRRAADAAAGVSMPVRLATNIVRFMHDNTGNWDGPAGGGVVSASFINAKPAVGGISVEPRGGGVLRVLFTVASGAVADTVVRWRWKLRQTQVAVFDVLSDREEARHRALWPAFLAAKAAGKRAQFHRARLVVDGERPLPPSPPPPSPPLPEPPPPPPVQDLDLWIVAGQSNAVGFNELDWTVVSCGQPIPGRMLMYPMSTRVWADALKGAGHISNGDLLPDSLEHQLPIGPEMTFGRALLESGSARRVGFVETAMGGTSLAAWSSPDGPLWRRMVDGTHAAVAAAGAGRRLQGLLWVQGETDALSETAAASYRERLSAFITALRSELRPYHAELPVIMALMSTNNREAQYPCIREVRKAQIDVAAVTPGIVTVDMGNYEHFWQDMNVGAGPQWTHLTKAGECSMGAGMAAAWLASGLA